MGNAQERYESIREMRGSIRKRNSYQVTESTKDIRKISFTPKYTGENVTFKWKNTHCLYLDFYKKINKQKMCLSM